MWETRRLITLRASMACYMDSVSFMRIKCIEEWRYRDVLNKRKTLIATVNNWYMYTWSYGSRACLVIKRRELCKLLNARLVASSTFRTQSFDTDMSLIFCCFKFHEYSDHGLPVTGTKWKIFITVPILFYSRITKLIFKQVCYCHTKY
jgi:hypothetical protein